MWAENGNVPLPSLSIYCDVEGVNAPPPLPTEVINITSVVTGAVIPREGGVRDVEATVRYVTGHIAKEGTERERERIGERDWERAREGERGRERVRLT